MALIIEEILRLLDQMAPPDLAEEWDNVGLQVGDPSREVEFVWVALDPTFEVVSAACRQGVGLLVTHHPLFIRPVKRIDSQTPLGAIVEEALRNRLSIYTMHTNLDAAPGGLNDLLARKTGIKLLKPLVGGRKESRQGGGIGRTGVLAARLSVRRLALMLKRNLGLAAVRIVGKPNCQVKRVAVSTGSGSSLLPYFLSSTAEVFITGDLRYHDARAIEAAGRCAIDIGHFHSEHLMTVAVASRLQRLLTLRRAGIRVQAYPGEKEPFLTV